MSTLLTLTNSGGQSLIIQSAALSDPADFTMTTSCGPTLPPETTCSYSVQFTPQAVTSATATLTLTDNNGGVGGSVQSVALTGKGTPVAVSQAVLAPANLSFGSNILQTASPTQTVTLNNAGTAPLAISGYTLTGAADFSVTATTCSTSLLPTASCTYTLSFTPQTTGTRNATLTITDSSGGAGISQQTANLSGTGLPVPVPQLTMSASALSFAPTVLMTNAASQTITLGNVGNAPLLISGVLLADKADYAVANTCGSTLAPGANCALAVTFHPQATGPLPSTLVLADNAGVTSGTVQQAIALAGTGLPAPVPQASLSPPTGLFAPIDVGATSPPQTFTLTNTGMAQLDISGITLSDSADFSLGNSCGATLAAGTSCSFTITFQPQGAGSLNASLMVIDNNNGVSGSKQSISLSGTAITLPAPQAVVSPAALSFPDTMATLSSTAQALTLSNIGNAPLLISSMVLSDTQDFNLNSNCPTSLLAGVSCVLVFIFQPQSVRTFQADITITDNSAAVDANSVGTAQQTVALSGKGTAFAEPRAVPSPTALSFPQTITNSSAGPQTVTLTNTGATPLTLSGLALSGASASAFALSSSSCVGALAAGASCSVTVTYSPRIGSAADTATLVFTDDALGKVGSTQIVPLTGSALAEVDSVENFGDSITCGFYAQPHDGTGLVYSLEGYAALFDTSLAVPAQNWCRQGDTAADLSRVWVPWNSTPTSTGNQLFTLMIGTNDAYRYGIPQTSLQTYSQEVGAALAWLAIPNSDKVLANSITAQNGAWSQDVGFGVKSTDSGASLTFNVNQAVAGRNLYVVYHVWALPYGQAGKATIAIDGTAQTTVDESMNSFVNLPTENGTSDTFLVQTVPLGAVGQHTVTFTSTGPSGSAAGLLWAGVPQQDYRNVDGAPRVMVGLITNSPSGNQTFVADIYNLQLKSLVPALTADGMNIRIVPTDRVLDTGTDFADILHPNTSGHAKLVAAFQQNR